MKEIRAGMPVVGAGSETTLGYGAVTGFRLL